MFTHTTVPMQQIVLFFFFSKYKRLLSAYIKLPINFMHLIRYACQLMYCYSRPQNKKVPQLKKGNRNQTWPYVCAWWTGRHHPGLSPGSHGLSSITVPLSRCQIVTCPACFVIIAKPHKIPLVLLSYTAHPKSVRGKTSSDTESCRQRWYTQHLLS